MSAFTLHFSLRLTSATSIERMMFSADSASDERYCSVAVCFSAGAEGGVDFVGAELDERSSS